MSKEEKTFPSVRITGLSHEAEGVGRLSDGRVVFVDGALPGDHVEIGVQDLRRKISYAPLTRIIEPSAGRVTPGCNVPGCGGCPLRMASTTLQATEKRARILATFQRLAGIDAEALLGPLQQGPHAWQARHRVRLHAAYLNKQWRLGYRKRRSHELVPLSSCPILWPELEQVALAFAEALRGLGPEAELTEVTLAYSRRDGRAAASLISEAPMSVLRRHPALWAALPVSGLSLRARDERLSFGNLELRYDHAQAHAYDLRFEPESFTQADPAANDLLVATVMAFLRPQLSPRILELHAGIGNFSLPLALGGARITATERARRAAILLKRNARQAGARVEVQALSDVQTLALGTENYDAVLLDPPRTGAREAVGMLAARSVAQIVYVSCDPATLARDAQMLVEQGYRLAQLAAVDMFVQTSHVETIARFERA